VGHIGWLANDQTEFAESVAWCDANPERLSLACERHPGLAAFTDYREMLQHSGIDAVVIATPNWLHCDMACEFLEAGIHVFVEKPMGINRSELDRMLDAAERSSARFAVDFEMRISSFAKHVQGVLESGRIGELRRMELVHHRGGWLEEGNGIWRTRPEQSGGLFLMEPIHAIDFFRMIAGEVESVQCIAGPNVLKNYRFPDNACTHLFFENGVTCVLLSSHTHSAVAKSQAEWLTFGHEMRWIFTGTEGSLAVDALRGAVLVNRYEVYPPGAEGTRVVFDSCADVSGEGLDFFHCIHTMRLDFLRRCATGEPPIQDVRDAWRTHLVCLAAEESAARGGCRVEMSYARESLS